MAIWEVQFAQAGVEGGWCALKGHIQAIVLLGGSVRASSLAIAVNRSVLDLPVETGRTLLSLWQSEAAELAIKLGVDKLPMRLMLDREAIEPAAAQARQSVILSVERDPYALRGTGGVLHDISEAYAENDYLLVANAGQLFVDPLWKLARQMAECGGDVVLMTHHDGSPSGLMLVRCGALKDIPPHGFVDMKEQALPVIARNQSVEVVQKSTRTAMGIRNADDYIRALRRHHQRLRGIDQEIGPLDEDWQQVFEIIEPGATVAEARVHDSVVLAGARIEKDSVLVRSVICGSALVRKGSMVVDEVVVK